MGEEDDLGHHCSHRHLGSLGHKHKTDSQSPFSDMFQRQGDNEGASDRLHEEAYSQILKTLE